MAGVLFPAGTRDVSLLHNVQAESGVHPASCLIGTRGSFPKGISGLGVLARYSPPPSSKVTMAELYLHSPYVLMACQI
jgi:hypothetical protein